MSGGSYDYMYCCDLDVGRVYDIDRMAAALRRRGFHAAADRTQQAAHHLRMARAVQSDLENVWQAVEWRESCDYGEEYVTEAVQRWNERRP